jgi:uncharacterized protein (DUF952 family)
VTPARTTFHLAAAESWSTADPTAALVAPSLDVEGFIHCTTGADEMVATANRHYRDDPRDFVVLTIDLDRVTSPVRTDDPGRIYPHVFGPIDRASILAVRPMRRAPDGMFLAFEAEQER